MVEETITHSFTLFFIIKNFLLKDGGAWKHEFLLTKYEKKLL